MEEIRRRGEKEAIKMNLLCEEDDCRSFIVEREGEVATPDGIDTGILPMMPEEDEIALLMEKESCFSPKEEYLSRLHSGSVNVSARNDSVEWIYQVASLYHFEPLTACLSVNYLDRFLSEDALPEGKPWIAQLLSVACLSIAAKMEETAVPPLLDLQVAETKFVFEPRTIERMEIFLLNTLKWKMNAVTPLSFIHFFLSRITHANPLPDSLVSKSVDLILTATKGIEFLEFRASEIALAAALSAIGEVKCENFIDAVVSCTSRLKKENVLKCYEFIQEMMLVKQCWNVKTLPSGSSVPGSPAGVLDAAVCLSYESSNGPPSSFEGSNTVEGAAMNSCRPYKRRKFTE